MMPWCKEEIPARIRKVAPTDADLDIIQSFYLPGETVNPDDLFIGRMSLANTLYDRSGERFPEAYLQQFAVTLPGKGVMVGHDYTREPAGHFYMAQVQGSADGHELVPSYYLLNSDPLTAKVKAGIARYVSIGFNPDLRVCDIDGKDYDGWYKGEADPCPHIALKEYEGTLARVTYGGDATKAEGLEGSFVWLGCQYGAQTMGANQALSSRSKSAYFDSQDHKGVWAFPEINLQRFGHTISVPPEVAAVYKRLGAQEKPMSDVEKGASPPAEARLTPEQERLIALGEAYVKFAQEHVKSRYGACKQERTGERLAASIERASVEEIAEELKAADDAFNEKFPGTGKGVPMSDQPAEPMAPRQFNPLRRVRG